MFTTKEGKTTHETHTVCPTLRRARKAEKYDLFIDRAYKILSVVQASFVQCIQVYSNTNTQDGVWCDTVVLNLGARARWWVVQLSTIDE